MFVQHDNLRSFLVLGQEALCFLAKRNNSNLNHELALETKKAKNIYHLKQQVEEFIFVKRAHKVDEMRCGENDVMGR